MLRVALLASLILGLPSALSAQTQPPEPGPDAAEVKRCIEALKDADPLKRSRAAEEIGAMWPPAKEAIGPLAGLLQDKELAVRRAAAQALSGFGADAGEVVPALIDAMGDEDDAVSSAAAVAVQLAGKASVEPLRKALGREEAKIRSTAAYLLGAIGEAAKAALPDLERLLEDKDEKVRRMSARSFALLGGRSALAARILCEPLGTGRDMGLDDVSLIATQGKVALPFLLDKLSQGGPEAKVAACAALGRIGQEARDLVPALGKALVDDVQGVRTAAARALGAIGPDAIETLAKGLKDEDAQTRTACAWAFAAMAKAFGKDARPAVPFLEAVLGDEAEQVRKGAQQALDILKKE